MSPAQWQGGGNLLQLHCLAARIKTIQLKACSSSSALCCCCQCGLHGPVCRLCRPEVIGGLRLDNALNYTCRTCYQLLMKHIQYAGISAAQGAHESSCRVCCSLHLPFVLRVCPSVQLLCCCQSGLDAGASIQALRRFNNALRAVSADNWGEQLREEDGQVALAVCWVIEHLCYSSLAAANSCTACGPCEGHRADCCPSRQTGVIMPVAPPAVEPCTELHDALPCCVVCSQGP